MGEGGVYPRIEQLLDANPATSEITRVRHALALQLARKLDEAIDDTTTGSAQATPGISKELRVVLEEIASAQSAKQEFVAGIFEG